MKYHALIVISTARSSSDSTLMWRQCNGIKGCAALDLVGPRPLVRSKAREIRIYGVASSALVTTGRIIQSAVIRVGLQSVKR